MPSLVSAGPAAGPVMGAMQRRHLFTVLPVVAVLTILSGLRLLWITSGGFGRAYFATPTGGTFAASGATAVLALVLSMLVSRPAAVRAATLSQAAAAAPAGAERDGLTAQADRMRRRSAVASQLVLVLLTASAAGMAVARYLR